MIIPFNHLTNDNSELVSKFPVHYSYYEDLVGNPKFPKNDAIGNGKKVIG